MFVIDWYPLAFMLVLGHVLADYPLQGDFLAQGKNRNTEIGKIFWPHALFAHSMIHGGMVAIITGIWWLGVLEAFLHGLIDFLKCENKISLNVDQALHYLCKIAWLIIAVKLAA